MSGQGAELLPCIFPWPSPGTAAAAAELGHVRQIPNRALKIILKICSSRGTCQSRWEVAGMPWGQHRDAVGMPWGSCWDAVGMPWGWHRDGTGMLWLHLSPPVQQVRLPWPPASLWHRGKGHTAPQPELLPLAALSHGSRTRNVLPWGCSCWEHHGLLLTWSCCPSLTDYFTCCFWGCFSPVCARVWVRTAFPARGAGGWQGRARPGSPRCPRGVTQGGSAPAAGTVPVAGHALRLVYRLEQVCSLDWR